MSILYLLLLLFAYSFYIQNKYSDSKFLIHKSFKFKSYDGRTNYSDILIGDKVNLWNKPETTEIRIYLVGADHGVGSIGVFNNEVIANSFQKDPNIRIKGSVLRKNSFGRIFLENELIYKN